MMIIIILLIIIITIKLWTLPFQFWISQIQDSMRRWIPLVVMKMRDRLCRWMSRIQALLLGKKLRLRICFDFLCWGQWDHPVSRRSHDFSSCWGPKYRSRNIGFGSCCGWWGSLTVSKKKKELELRLSSKKAKWSYKYGICYSPYPDRKT